MKENGVEKKKRKRKKKTRLLGRSEFVDLEARDEDSEAHDSHEDDGSDESGFLEGFVDDEIIYDTQSSRSSREGTPPPSEDIQAVYFRSVNQTPETPPYLRNYRQRNKAALDCTSEDPSPSYDDRPSSPREAYKGVKVTPLPS